MIMDWGNLSFNICASIATLFLLNYSTDAFITNTTILARRGGVPEVLVILLGVGAEWEILALTTSSALQHHSSLVLGTVIGCSISNVLLGFSFGLLFHPDPTPTLFSLNSKLYCALLLIASSFYTVLAFTGFLDLTGGIFFLVLFGVYVVSVCEGVYERVLVEEPDVEDIVVDEVREEEEGPSEREMHRELHIAIYPSIMACHPNEVRPLIPRDPNAPGEQTIGQGRIDRKSFYWIRIFLAFIIMGVSSFVLAHVSANLADAVGLSDVMFGMTVLSFFTTISAKLIPSITTWRRNTGTMIASIAGSNNFLLTLCLGVVFVSGGTNEELADKVLGPEVWTCWGCSLLLLLVVLIGGRKWMGAVILGLYAGWVGTELGVYRR